MKNIKQYYKEVGKLVYLVAAADGMVQEEERLVLHNFVMKELAAMEHESDSSGMNKAFYVDFEFEKSESSPPDESEVLASFNRYIDANHEAGDEPLLEQTTHLLEKVANAYNHRREKNLINAVKEKFSQISDKEG